MKKYSFFTSALSNGDVIYIPPVQVNEPFRHKTEESKMNYNEFQA